MDDFTKLKEEGRRHLLEKKYPEAQEQYENALKVLSDNVLQIPKRDIAIVHLNIGVCHINQNQNQAALACIDQAIEADATYFKSFYRKAQILLEMKDFSQALQITQQLMSKEPCKEVYDLRKLITDTMLKHSNMYDFEAIKADLDECSSEKDIQKVFAGLYQRPEDLEAYHAILDEERGFCQQLLDYSITKAQINFLALKYVGFVWGQIKAVLKERRYFLPEWLTQWLIHNFKQVIESNIGKKQELLQSYFGLLQFSNIVHGKVIHQLQELIEMYPNHLLNKNLLDIARLFSMNLRYCEKCSAQELEAICTERQRFMDVTVDLNLQLARYLKSITLDGLEFDSENEQVHLIWELMISILKIADTIQVKLQSLKIAVRDPYALSYLQKDYFSRKDLFSLISLAGANPTQFYVKSKLHNLPNKLLCTLVKKREKMKTVDLIKYLFGLVIRDEDFTKGLSESVYSERVNNEIQEFLKHRHNQNKIEFKYMIKYLTILFQINTRAKFLSLYDYLVLIDCDSFIEQLFVADVLVHESLTLLTFIATFDDVKKILIKRKDQLQPYVSKAAAQIQEMQSDRTSTIHKIHVYSANVSLLQFLLSLCVDQSKDYREDQKERFGIDDEQFRMAKELEKKYKPEGSMDTDKFFRYDEHYIKKHEALFIVGMNLNAIKIISDFVGAYEDQMTEYAKKLVAQILSRLSNDDNLVPHLFDKRSLRLVAKLCLADARQSNDSYQYLSKVMRSANPNLFEYKDLHILVDALLLSATSSKHELQIFHSLLGLVQLSSLGDDVCQKLALPNQIVTLQNFMLEENQYIIHATLQILNNVALSSKFQQEMEAREMNNFFKILTAIFEMEYDRLLKYFLNEKMQTQKSKLREQIQDEEVLVGPTDFSHPLLMMQTLISLFAIFSFWPKFREHTKDQLQLLRNTEFYQYLLLILKEQPPHLQFDFAHKIVCLIENYQLEQQLAHQIVMLKNMFEPIRKQLLEDAKGDQLVKEKIEKIMKLYTQ